MDRMSILLDNEGDVYPEGHYQGIFPEVGFTCSGQLLGWVFGAKWEGNSPSFTYGDLQVLMESSLKLATPLLPPLKAVQIFTTTLSLLHWLSKQEMSWDITSLHHSKAN